MWEPPPQGSVGLRLDFFVRIRAITMNACGCRPHSIDDVGAKTVTAVCFCRATWNMWTAGGGQARDFSCVLGRAAAFVTSNFDSTPYSNH